MNIEPDETAKEPAVPRKIPTEELLPDFGSDDDETVEKGPIPMEVDQCAVDIPMTGEALADTKATVEMKVDHGRDKGGDR